MIKLPINYLEVEQVYGNTIGRGMRSLAVTSTNSGEGCSTMAYAMSKRSEADGKHTLLVEVNLLHPEMGDLSGHLHTDWLPNPSSADGCIMHDDEADIDILPAPCDTDAIMFRNLSNMNKLMEYWLERYDVVVFDTSPVMAINRNNIPAESICAMVDGTIMMVMAGVTRQTDLQSSIDKLRHHDATLAGFIYNDLYNPRLADELVRETKRFDKWFPNAMDKLRRYVRKSSFLNIEL
ncbi:MAG: CpsD/CapB family tyrosine-protein kinase [Endozoicomonas sp.]|uniref:CpsD/CapB family tyrosine-protein kinase n=1 Tax=Endozoicomonas sp. TaxID=1892382 RepID=UPI003D9ABF32